MRLICIVFLFIFSFCKADSIESSNANFLDSKVDFIESSLESNAFIESNFTQDSNIFIESNSFKDSIRLAAYNDFNSTQTPHKNYGPEGAFMPLDYGSPGDFELLDGKRKGGSNSNTTESSRGGTKGGGDNFVNGDSPFNTIDNSGDSSYGDSGYGGDGYGSGSGSGQGGSGYGGGGYGGSGSGGSSGKGKGKLVLDSLSPIYFDFDRYNIRADMQEYIRANADFIKEHNIESVVLQGNTDEVGSDEYNMALGHKRALSVRDALVIYGLPKSMFSTISYGTHNPTCLEHTKECHAKNRRTEIVEKSGE